MALFIFLLLNLVYNDSQKLAPLVTILGRTKGSRNKKSRRLDTYNQQINYYLNLKISIGAILKILNNQMEIPISYTALRYHIHHEPNLHNIKANF